MRRPRILRPLESASFDKGNLYHSSHSLLLAHEDKSFAGALIASLAIPWGEAKGDNDQGGYHLVWTRDMVNSATALLAAGDTRDTASGAHLSCSIATRRRQLSAEFLGKRRRLLERSSTGRSRLPDHACLASTLRERAGRIRPFPIVLQGRRHLIRNGPVTQQERWEEVYGYSPSTLASNIAALICASVLFRET